MRKPRLNNVWLAALAAVIIGSLTLFWIKRASLQRPAVFSQQPIQEAANPKHEADEPRVSPIADRPVQPKPAHEIEGEPTLRITHLAQPPQTPKPSSALRVQHVSGTIVLLDTSGKVLLGSPEKPVFAAALSPSEKRVLVHRGSGVHQIYRLDPFELVRQLPLMPGIPRASAFGPWNWVDENTLLAAVSISHPPGELTHLTAAERESPANWREQTLLYSLNLADGTMRRIDTARAGLPPSFTVIEMHAGGLVKVEWDEQGTARSMWIAAHSK